MIDHIGMIDASGGILDQDYEMFEQQTPHLLLEHEYWCDSAGAGEWRGGLGVQTRFVIGSDNTRVVTFGDGDIEPAFGVHGGKPGTLNIIKLIYPGDKVYKATTKDLIENVPKGTVFFQQAGGGGGYGEPYGRSPEKVFQDVRNEVLSPDQARKLYGVVIDVETMTLDRQETENLRTGFKI